MRSLTSIILKLKWMTRGRMTYSGDTFLIAETDGPAVGRWPLRGPAREGAAASGARSQAKTGAGIGNASPDTRNAVS